MTLTHLANSQVPSALGVQEGMKERMNGGCKGEREATPEDSTVYFEQLRSH